MAQPPRLAVRPKLRTSSRLAERVSRRPKLARLLAGHCRGSTHRPPPAALSTSCAGARLAERQRAGGAGARGHSRVYNPVELAACEEGAPPRDDWPRTCRRGRAGAALASGSKGAPAPAQGELLPGRGGTEDLVGGSARGAGGGGAYGGCSATPARGAERGARLPDTATSCRHKRQTSCDEVLDTRTEFTHFERRRACSCAPRWHHTPRGDILHETIWRVAKGPLAGCGRAGLSSPVRSNCFVIRLLREGRTGADRWQPCTVRWARVRGAARAGRRAPKSRIFVIDLSPLGDLIGITHEILRGSAR